MVAAETEAAAVASNRAAPVTMVLIVMISQSEVITSIYGGRVRIRRVVVWPHRFAPIDRAGDDRYREVRSERQRPADRVLALRGSDACSDKCARGRIDR